MMISGNWFKHSGDEYYLTKDVGIPLSKLRLISIKQICLMLYTQFKKVMSDVIKEVSNHVGTFYF